MYLIVVEGGDGSGKGAAIKLLRDIVADEFTFDAIHLTHEPRRHSRLGRLARKAVEAGDHSSIEEAGLFAADRIDHSHSWIRPLLQKGGLVISDRNVHSSLVYQGVLGEIDLDVIAKMNSAALIPDLVIWIDCDVEHALKRLHSGTLRSLALTDEDLESQYFETSETQKIIREGFRGLLSGQIRVPPPFDRSRIVGPILNEGSLDDLNRRLRVALTAFIYSHPEPLNVDVHQVDLAFLETLMSSSSSQGTLPGFEQPEHVSTESYLEGRSAADWISKAEKHLDAAAARAANVAANPMNRSYASIMGTLSLIGSANVARLRRRLGPARLVSESYTQSMLKWLDENDMVRRQQLHKRFRKDGGAVYRLRAEWFGFGRLLMALLPAVPAMRSWRRKHPTANWSGAMANLVRQAKSDAEMHHLLDAVCERLALLGAGIPDWQSPSDHSSLLAWWTAS